jgi:hypothetical protein
MEMKKFNIKSMEGKAQTKHEIYTMMTAEGKWYLPPERVCTMEFIRNITIGAKKVLTFLNLSPFYRLSKPRRSRYVQCLTSKDLQWRRSWTFVLTNAMERCICQIS